MRYYFGRLLQVIGLLVMPIGMAGNLLYPNIITESHILMTLCIGLVFLFIGQFVQGRSRP